MSEPQWRIERDKRGRIVKMYERTANGWFEVECDAARLAAAEEREQIVAELRRRADHLRSYAFGGDKLDSAADDIEQGSHWRDQRGTEREGAE